MSLFKRSARASRTGRVSRPKPAVVAGVTVPAVLAVLAIINPGVKIAEVELNDGAVWVTNAQGLKLGRYNATVEELNGGLIATDPTFNVFQDAQDVILVEPSKVSVVDPASVTLATQAEIPLGSQVDMAAGIVSIVGLDGSVWVRPTDSLETIDAATDGDLQLGEGAKATVTRDGAVLAVDPTDGTVHRVDPADGEGQGEVATLTDAAGVLPDAVAAVGDDLVMISGTTVYAESWSLDVSEHGARPVLQQTSDTHDTVLVATTTSLLEIDLESGDVEVREPGGVGAPARPVRVAGCDYAAWASMSSSYVESCGDNEPRVEDLEAMTATSNLVFRVNRSVVVVNDTVEGRLWLPTDLPKVQEPNWQDIEQEEEPEDQQDTSDDVQTAQQLLTQCTEQSMVPGAADDAIGVRAGRTSVLQILGNDTAGECGIIAISAFDQIPETFGYLESIYGGRDLQLVVRPDATGTVSFTYTITDGRGQNPPSTATVQLTVRDASSNEDPVQVRTGAVEVEQGALIEYDALANFTDPDGDDLVLAGATTDGTGSVRARQDGMVTFVADGDQLGRQVVQLTVTDGMSSVLGEMFVDVRPAGSLPPIIDPVHAVTYVDAPVEVDVLASVRSASREPARLAAVDEVAGTTILPKLDDGSFTFSAANTGTYYVSFTVTAPPQQAIGLARIDVREWPGTPLPPIAVRDVALLPSGGEVTVDPLANDTDPNGGVLVLTSATASPDSAMQIAILEHRLVRVTSLRALEAPETISYVVSNGVAETRGEILVQPVPPSAEQHAPVVQDIEVSVRTGGVVTIPALEYAYDADGDVMELVPELAEPLGDGQGLLFVSGNQLRYQAPSTPMTASATFSVRDTALNVGSARLTVTVHASSAATKSPPRPKDLTSRTFAGETVRINVPLTGIDGDGDGVILLGQGDTPPTKGRIVAVGASWIEYEAFPGESGTDTFTYAVEDWVGQRAVATVRVGIAPRPSEPLPIVARNDEVTVQPGELVEVRVVRNDVDPSGGELSLSPDIIVPPGVDARTEGRRIVVQAPAEPVDITIAYTVTNDRGGQASAVLTVRVVADAVILPPVASDIRVAPIEVVGKTSIEVDVFEVAENPSGPLSDLEVSIPSSHSSVASVVSSGRVLVTLSEEAQTVPYLLTNTNSDAGGVHAYAFITVPALGDFPPVLRPKARSLRVASGAELVIPIAEFVQVGTAKTARIGDSEKVSATRSDGTELVVDDTTLRYRSAAGYAGPASITFEVTDGISSSDTTGRRATLTLPITVFTEDDYPPTFAPSTLEIPQGDAASAVNLLAFTEGPEGADEEQPYTFRLASTPPPGFAVNLTGTELSVSAAADVPRGTTGAAQLTLGYGRAGTLDVTVNFKVVASKRVLASVSDFSLDGAAGKESRVDVLATGALNPFPSDPLALQGATVETVGAGTAAVSGSSVLVRPVDGFVGTMVVRYRVRDVTGDPLREVEGRVTVNVRDVPAAPASPRVGEVSNQTLVLSWDAPSANGAPITGYRLTRSPGGQTTQCATTTCTITGLTNGTEYTFTVAAQNAVGWSKESASSAKATPDAVPDAPGAPVLVFGDRQITASWTAPANVGTPITQYTVEISPMPTSGRSTQTTSGTSVAFTGLTNGTDYQVRVRAHNRATPPEGGAWGPWSGSMRPAGVPGAPAVTASRVDSGRINVAWTPPAANGDPIAGYTLTTSGDGAPGPVQLDGSTTSWAFDTAQNGVSYTFTVTARNKAGVGSGGVSEPTSTYAPPSAPRSPGIAAVAPRNFGDGAVDLSWSAPAETGGVLVGIDHYEVFANGSLIASPAGTSFRVTGLPGGTPTPAYSVVACNTRSACGPATVLGSATPITLPAVPGVTGAPVAGTYDTVQFSWTSAGTGGGTSFTYRYRVSTGGGWTETTGTSVTVSGVPESGASIEVYAVTSAGQSPQAGTAAAVPPPRTAPSAPQVTVSSSAAKRLSFSWTVPATNGSDLQRYRYRVFRFDGTDFVPEGAEGSVNPGTTSVTDRTVQGGTYRVDVWTESSKGIGATGTSPEIVVP
ncbi:fibronectin type III domain-containing protein [Sanguibacter sp. 25GB23B1]|uniref:Ig-like domain-containing protein n=1 Tax=unclassified Sanguibacter TaxID=2645534 RepID=UPI0032AF1026